MAQALYHCQQISPSRGLFRILVSGVIVLGVSCLGCWQEVHYNPSESEPGKSEPAESAEPISPVAVVEPEEPVQEVAPAPAPAELFGGTEPAVDEVVPAPIEVRDPVVEWEGASDPSAEVNSPGELRTTLAAWRMASDWSMAVALQAKGRDEARYGERLERAKLEAQRLGVELPYMLLHNEGADRLSANLAYLLEEAGPRLASELGELHGTDHTALVELATKSHVLLLSYTPSSTRLEPVIVAIRQAAESSGLPESVWRELVDLLAARAEFKQVKAAVYQLHQRAVDSLEQDK